MENDFEGEMFDVPKGDDQEQDKVLLFVDLTLFLCYACIIGD